MMIKYAIEHLGARKFVVKIGQENSILVACLIFILCE